MSLKPPVITLAVLQSVYEQDCLVPFAKTVFKASVASLADIGLGFPVDAEGNPVDLTADQCTQLSVLLTEAIKVARAKFLAGKARLTQEYETQVNSALAEFQLSLDNDNDCVE